MRIRTFLIAGLMAAATVQAGDKQVDSAAAFSRLKTLAGEWEANTSMGKERVTYELIAGGTALVERESGEHMPAMATVYHMDGDRLILTHYCMAGNQPRMEARGFDAKSGELRFQFLDATNLAGSGAGHMRNATFRLAGADRFSAAWEFYESGKPKRTEAFEYTRVR
jgi:hypothetical protein